MIWESWSDFFAMGGYAVYVWGSFFVVFGCMACEAIFLTLRRRSISKQLANKQAIRRVHGANNETEA